MSLKIDPIAPALLALALAAGAGAALAQGVTDQDIEDEREFMRMTQPPAEEGECEFERPPRDLGPSALVRNGYSATRKIMAAEWWERTGSCECFYERISWDEAKAEAQSRFVTYDSVAAPFDIVELQQLAENKIAARDRACES